MKTEYFWAIIRDTQYRDGEAIDVIKQQEALISTLSILNESDIIDFYNILCKLLEKANTLPLWYASFFIHCYTSEDVFLYFRLWLIVKGDEIFYKALANPDTLADVVSIDTETNAERLLCVANTAYIQKTGVEMPRRNNSEPIKSEVDHSKANVENYVKNNYPRLYGKLGVCSERLQW